MAYIVFTKLRGTVKYTKEEPDPYHFAQWTFMFDVKNNQWHWVTVDKSEYNANYKYWEVININQVPIKYQAEVLLMR